MSLQRMLGGDPARNSLVYLAIGGLSLAKAIAVRNDSARFRRELRDAVIFIGVGLLLRRYATMKAQKREEIRESVPDWVLGESGSETGLPGRAKRRFGGESEPRPEATIGDRARRMLSN